MVIKGDLQYDKIYVDNADINALCTKYSDYVKIFVKGSSNPFTNEGKYLYVVNYKDHNITGEKTFETSSSNRASLEGIYDALQHIKDGYKIMIVSSTLLGFRKGFTGKGNNADIVQNILEQLKAMNCTLLECVLLGKKEQFNAYVYSFFKGSDIAQKIKLDNANASSAATKDYKYFKKVYNKCLADILDVLENTDVNQDVMELVKGLKK